MARLRQLTEAFCCIRPRQANKRLTLLVSSRAGSVITCTERNGVLVTIPPTFAGAGDIQAMAQGANGFVLAREWFQFTPQEETKK